MESVSGVQKGLKLNFTLATNEWSIKSQRPVLFSVFINRSILDTCNPLELSPLSSFLFSYGGKSNNNHERVRLTRTISLRSQQSSRSRTNETLVSDLILVYLQGLQPASYPPLDRLLPPKYIYILYTYPLAS